MSFKLDELGGHAVYKNVTGFYYPGWYFISERGLSKGQTFGPWDTPELALEFGPVHAVCAGVEMATKRGE